MYFLISLLINHQEPCIVDYTVKFTVDIDVFKITTKTETKITLKQ